MPKQFNPKVSIVIPVYNGSNYLKEAIDSALAQTYKNIEVIVINDGSNDKGETDKICKSYGNKIRYYKKENGGVASALNMGIEKMKGEYFSWLSHDDIYHPEKTLKQVVLAEGIDQDIIVISNKAIISETGDLLKKKIIDKRLEDFPNCSLLFSPSMYLDSRAMLIPKVIFERYGTFEEGKEPFQDQDMWLKLSTEIKFRVVEDYLLYSKSYEQRGYFASSSRLVASDMVYGKVLETLSTEEVLNYFKEKEEDIWVSYNFFLERGYKRTAASILRIIIEGLISKRRYLEVSTILEKELINKNIENELKFGGIEGDIINKIKVSNQRQMKRLLFVSGHWYTGGVERVLSNLFKKLVEYYEVILITPVTEDEGCITIPKEVLHIKVSKDFFRDRFDFIIFSFSLLLDVEVVIGCMNLFKQILDFYVLSEGSSFKTIASNHEYYFYPYHNPDLHNIVKKREEAFRLVDCVVQLTNFSAAVSDLFSGNGYLLPNPNTFEIQENDIRQKNEKIILCVGRFNDPVKRVDRILMVFKEVLKRIPDAQLVLVGKCDVNLSFSRDGNKTIKDLQRELRLPEEKVIFVGEVADIDKYYKKASVLLLTSDSEGFPMIVNEAASFGVPTVSNQIPGLDDIIVEGVNGFLTAQGDIEGMSEKVSDILSNDSLRIELGNKSKELARSFELDKISKRWVVLVETLTGGHPQRKAQKILREHFSYQIKNYKDFAYLLCMEINSIFNQSIKDGSLSGMRSKSGEIFCIELGPPVKTREIFIDKILRFIISIREIGLKSTFIKYVKNMKGAVINVLVHRDKINGGHK